MQALGKGKKLEILCQDSAVLQKNIYRFMFLPQLGLFFIMKEQEDKLKHNNLLLYKASKQRASPALKDKQDEPSDVHAVQKH